MSMHRKTYLEINEKSIRFNIKYIKAITNKKLIVVLKANGYGTNDVELAKIAQKENVDLLAVSSIEEALHLRKEGIETEILILGEVDCDDLGLVKENNFQIVTVSKDYIENNLDKLAGIKIHLKINTGMNRIGILPNEARSVYSSLRRANAIIVGIMTHYVSSDDNDSLTQRQYEVFKKVVSSFDYQFKYIHSCNTDAALSIRDEVSNYVRCGLGVLGYSARKNELKPSLSLFSEVVNVKTVPKGEGVSYGHHFVSDGDGYILTLPVGYADGFIRANTNKKVYIDGEECKIVGSVCMDQMMVRSFKPHPIGSKVELFGEHISLEKRAQDLKTITYEIITNISDRVTRVFVDEEKTVETINVRFR